MGMFDTIETEPFKCPHCNKDVDTGFQTKDGPRVLHVYRIGDEFSVCIDRGDNWVWRTRNRRVIDVYTSCHNCRAFIDAHVILEKKTSKILRIKLYKYEIYLGKNKIIRE
jgi:hypothetical protein